MDATVEALLHEVRRLRDHEEIRQLLYRYARGVDRADPDLVRSVYTEQGTDHHGRFDGPGSEFAQVVVDKARLVWDAVGNHHITNILIELDGDRASVETYFLALHPHNDNGPVELALLSGRYVDQLARENGKWGILRRRVITDTTRSNIPGEPWAHMVPEDGGFLGGRRGYEDASYVLLGAAPEVDVSVLR